MKSKIISFSLAAAVMAATLATSAVPASAKPCLFVNLVITNDSRYPVSLRKVYFVDPNNRPRTEDIRNVKLLPGQVHREKAAFRKVGGKRISLQVSYKSLRPKTNGKGSKWSALKRSPLVSSGVCKSRSTKNISIPR